MRIYFARHGESQANLLHVISNRDLPHPLTSTGRQQAAALADHLAGLRTDGRPLSRIYTSPVPRAQETSAILADRLGLNCMVADALREYDCGEAEGRADEAAWAAWHEFHDAWVTHHQWDRRIPGGESFADIRARFVPFIDDLVRESGAADAGLICVSHGGVYGLMLPLVLQNVDHALIREHGFAYTTCITTELTPRGLVCLDWNGVPL